MILTFLLLGGLVYAEDIPGPQGRINDFAGVISHEYKDKIGALIAKVEAETTAETAVVTINSIAPYDEQTYARMIFDNWKIGKKGKDNGILLLIAVKERRWRIETGYGLEGILPDGLCGEIGRKYMVPYLKESRYGEGLYNGILALTRQMLSADKNISVGDLETTDDITDMPGKILMTVIVAIFFFVWNLPWPVFVGLPFTLIFAAAFFGNSPYLSLSVLLGYASSMLFRYGYWNRLPEHKRKNFFGAQTYGGRFTTGGYGRGVGGFGGGGFGGGGGGGGGAGGGF